ncbi:hypothetical protein NQ315_016037 [Exocentrus adspersus]|uniref:Uncharacterized protein n=1 Tax=Exocentrus adspersus TaxID=1586481 RepID=A0AAV8V903_9CUCU|nr:hypothetical protein NQ315_016037 [Exocentrus adspersus]
MLGVKWEVGMPELPWRLRNPRLGQPQANSTLIVPLTGLEDEETTEEEVRMANTTLREAIDNGRTPSTPKFISPYHVQSGNRECPNLH